MQQTALAVDERAMRRAARWLSQHGLRELTPTPLLAARLRARRRLQAGVLGAAVLLFVLSTVLHIALGLYEEPFERGNVARLVVYHCVVLVGLLLIGGLMIASRRADRRLGAAVTRRVAHPVALGWRDVVGGRAIVVAAIVYASSIALGVAAAVLARTAQDRLILAGLLVGLPVLVAATAAGVAYTVRRPAIADDPGSLAADDALRGEDARNLMASPLPLILVSYTAMSLEPGVWGRLAGVTLPVTVVILVLVMWGLSRPRRRVPAGAS